MQELDSTLQEQRLGYSQHLLVPIYLHIITVPAQSLVELSINL